MSKKVHTTDVLIVGAGPTGLFAVFQCGMLGMKAHVVDALVATGGQCTALYPEKPIYDIPGFPSIAGAELIEQLERQAEVFSPVFHMSQQATSLQKLGDGRFEVTTSKSVIINAATIIIAAGAGAFGPNRPPLEGLKAYEDKSVFYVVRRRSDMEGKKIVIAGGGDSAVDWATSLPSVAEKIYVVHRRDKFRAAPESVARMRSLAGEGKIEMIVPYQLAGIEGRDGQMESIVVKDMKGQKRKLEADILLPFYGLAADLGPLSEWGFGLDHNQIPVEQSSSETGIPGIFAVGDVCTYPNKLKLILCGFSEVAIAAHHAHKYVFPEKELHFTHSTSRGIPKK